MSWVFRNSPVKQRGDLLVLLVLADHAQDDGSNAFPGVQTIAHHARLTRRGAQLALRRLEDDGHITAAGKGPKGTVSYRVHMGEPTSPANSLRGELHAQGGEVSDTQGANPTSPEPSLDPSTDPPASERAQAFATTLLARTTPGRPTTSDHDHAHAFAALAIEAGVTVDQVLAVAKDPRPSSLRRNAALVLREASQVTTPTETMAELADRITAAHAREAA